MLGLCVFSSYEIAIKHKKMRLALVVYILGTRGLRLVSILYVLKIIIDTKETFYTLHLLVVFVGVRIYTDPNKKV